MMNGGASRQPHEGQRPHARWPAPGALLALTLSLLAGVVLTPGPATARNDPNLQPFRNPTGQVITTSSRGLIDTSNPFFQSIGANGRACVTCHQPGDAWSVTPPHLKERFDVSQGLDPIFRPNDGSNSPNADVSSLAARREAYSMLLNKGLIRVGLPIPDNAEFKLVHVDDPYGFASAEELSLFRRPLPATNLRFLSAVMWDGRETIDAIKDTSSGALQSDLAHQANSATTGHAQAAKSISDEQARQIVAFELELSTAQQRDDAAGDLHTKGVSGGPDGLPDQDFFIGINDPLGQNPKGTAFNSVTFSLFDGWEHLAGRDRTTAARLAVARGQALFNTKPITIKGVGGLNDATGQASIQGFCTTCHDTPNLGNHSVSAPLNIGLTDASRRTADLPLYTLRRNGSSDTIQTTDPGRALVTGKWADIGKFKGPILRGLAARAPYFHNGSAATLADVVDFYDTRFDLQLTNQEKADLVAFLRAL